MALPPLESLPDAGGQDCVKCGRCCHHPPETVHMLMSDDARVLSHRAGVEILRTLTVLDPRPPGWRFLRNAGERCAALATTSDGRYPCRIYEVRPDDCRAFEPGSAACLEARKLGRLGRRV
jgi:Fe-S-cluster containining protein